MYVAYWHKYVIYINWTVSVTFLNTALAWECSLGLTAYRCPLSQRSGRCVHLLPTMRVLWILQVCLRLPVVSSFFFFSCVVLKKKKICSMWVAKRVGNVAEGSFNCLFPKEDRKASHHVCVRASCLWLWPSANCHSPWDFSAPICVLHSLLLTLLESSGTVSVHVLPRFHVFHVYHVSSDKCRAQVPL